MKRFVVTFDSMYKPAVRAYLSLHRVQYSMSTDINTDEIRVSLPHAKVAAFTSDMRRCSIPYMIDC